jgi:RNA polymerase sigma factor for flagellar operon FliA
MDEREKTIRELLPIVRAMAKRIHRLVPSVDVDDLVGDGSVGLIRAVDGFDPARGTTLEHYARRLILGKMLNGIRRMDPVSERARREVRDAERERYRIAVERGSIPSLAEMMESRPHLDAALRQASHAVPLSLDRALPLGVDPPLDHGSDPATIVSSQTTVENLQGWIRSLPERHRTVLTMHYFDERSLRSVGEHLAISSQRASQLHVNALERLRKMADGTTD